MRKGLIVMMSVILVLVALGNAYATTYTYMAVDYPGASSPLGTTANGINDAGTIVGYYRDGNGDLYRGFSLTNGTYTSISYPGSLGTVALGINNGGTIVGYHYGSMSYETYGFSLSGGNYTPINYPGGQSTEPRGINSAGTIIGNYWNGNSYHGFSLSGVDYTPIDYPGASNTLPRGINEAGTVVGQYWDGTGRHAFSLSGETYTSFDYPGALETEAWDISDAGTIVGIYRDTSGYHSFSLTGTTYSPLAYPGSLDTSGISINSQGTIVGAYWDGSMSHGYVANPIPITVVAQFDADVVDGYTPLTVSFTDGSTGPIDSWAWNFGDGQTSIERNPSHTYSVPGTYTVSLTVTGPSTSSTETKTDYVTAHLYDAPDLTGRVKAFSSTLFGAAVASTVQANNIGNRNASRFYVAMYLSEDGTNRIQPSLQEVVVPLGLKQATTKDVKLGYSFTSSMSGKYLIIDIDSGNVITERNETNNKLVIKIP